MKTSIQSSLIISCYSFPISIPDFSSRLLTPGENAALQIYYRTQIAKRAIRLVQKAEASSPEEVLSQETLEELSSKISTMEYSFDNWKLPEGKSLLQLEIEEVEEENADLFISSKKIFEIARARLIARLSATSPEHLGF